MNTASRRSRLPHLSAPSVQPHRHPSIVLRRPALHRIRGMNNVGRIPRAFEWLMAALAILVIPALVLERRAPTPEIRTAALVLNWVIWLAFVIEFVVRWIADGRRSFPRRAWFDVVLIAVTPPIGVPDSMQGFHRRPCPNRLRRKRPRRKLPRRHQQPSPLRPSALPRVRSPCLGKHSQTGGTSRHPRGSR
jgi:hypothetical protein